MNIKLIKSKNIVKFKLVNKFIVQRQILEISILQKTIDACYFQLSITCM